LGRCLDVDRDGRFTLLFTGWLGRLQGGKVSLGGFVRGSDFCRDLAAPYGNGCDVMYLNTDLRPGPYLRTVLAHEYAHAVAVSARLAGPPGAEPGEEESWLNEAVAHLAEDRYGYGWENLDYRVSAFLNGPERCRLVVPDYYGSGLWRDPGTRGATYLFLRWCADRHGDELAARLIQSDLSGVANLEAATQECFADLFRQWTAALALSGTNLAAADLAPLRQIDPRRPLGGRLLCGPRQDEVPLAGGRHEVALAGTSAAYVLLHSPAAARSRLTVAAEPGADLQVSLVRLPDSTARLSLRAQKDAAEGTVRLCLTAHDARVVLDGAAWERLEVAGTRPAATSYRPECPVSKAVQAWFGDPRMEPNETRTSAVIPLPEGSSRGGGWVFKVVATDAAGHRLATWCAAP
jgi:hypothetical protein